MIWVVLPIYNEEGVIAKFIHSIQRELNKAHLDFSLIAVNDGSDDKSEVILNDLAKEISIHLINHPKNQGLGETIRDGLLFASKRSKEDDWIVTMDADNTHPPEYIPKLSEKGSQGYNLIIASRYQKGAKEEGQGRPREKGRVEEIVTGPRRPSSSDPGPVITVAGL